MNMFRKLWKNRHGNYSPETRGPACPATSEDWQPDAAVYRKPVAFIPGFAALVLLSSCTVTSPNFDEYTNVNLIPDSDLANWLPDQDVQSLNTAAELPNATISASAPYMRFERIDTAPSGNFVADTGFADSNALYSGMPSSVYKSDGSGPAVFRLEVNNLLINGDFESAWTPPTGVDGTDTTNGNGVSLHDNVDPGSPTITLVSGLTSSSATAMQFGANQPSDYLFLDFTTALVANSFSLSEIASYNISFDFNSTGDFALAWGDRALSTYTPLDVKYPSASYYNTTVNFPTGTSQQVSAFTTDGSTESILSINPWASGERTQKIVSATIDNFSVVRTDKSYALSFTVPKLTSAESNGSRLPLMNGGVYTLKLMVRADPTATQNNRFAAKHLSVAIHEDTSRTSGYLAGTTFAAADSSNWAGWTELTATVSGLLTGLSEYAAHADSDNLIQINITPMDTTNSNTQVAGSVLIAAPRLYWSASE